MKEASDYNMTFIVMCDDLVGFKANPRAEKYFRNLQKAVSASVLVHHNDIAIGFADEFDMDELMTQEYIATVIIPSKNVSDQDELI